MVCFGPPCRLVRKARARSGPFMNIAMKPELGPRAGPYSCRPLPGTSFRATLRARVRARRFFSRLRASTPRMTRRRAGTTKMVAATTVICLYSEAADAQMRARGSRSETFHKTTQPQQNVGDHKQRGRQRPAQTAGERAIPSGSTWQRARSRTVSDWTAGQGQRATATPSARRARAHEPGTSARSSVSVFLFACSGKAPFFTRGKREPRLKRGSNLSNSRHGKRLQFNGGRFLR